MQKYKITYTPFYLITIVSLAVLLFIIATLLNAFLSSQDWVSGFKGNINFVVELSNEINDEQIGDLTELLKRTQSVSDTTVIHIDKEEALHFMEKELGTGLIIDGMDNPFRDVVQFNMLADMVQPGRVRTLKNELEKIPYVDRMYYPEDLFSGIEKNLRKMLSAGTLVVVLLLILIAILIHQIIKMNILSNRFLIRTMEMVGAKYSFIRKPFLREAFKIGFLSALLAILGFVLVTFFVPFHLDILPSNVKRNSLLMVCIAVFVIGILISMISAYMAVNKYVGKSKEQLYT